MTAGDQQRTTALSLYSSGYVWLPLAYPSIVTLFLSSRSVSDLVGFASLLSCVYSLCGAREEHKREPTIDCHVLRALFG